VAGVRSKLGRLIRSLLPGIFLFGFCIGTGSVTAMAKAGADYGMALLWTVLLSCAITYYLITLYGKLTLVTGQTTLALFRRHIHPAVGYFFVVTLTAHVCGSVVGVMGIVSEICHQWSRSWVDGGYSPLAFALLFSAGVYLLFLDGRTKVFEQVLAVIVGVMSVCFLLNLFVAMPPLKDVVRGLVPALPTSGDGANAFLVVASMVGTTIFSGLFILRGSLVKEAGWTLEQYGIQRRDAAFSAIMMFLASASIMAAGAATLHVRGVRLDSVTQMIDLLQPLAGPAAVGIFVLGVVAAGVSSQFPNVTLLPWLLNDYHGRPGSMRRRDYRLMVLGVSSLGLVVPLLQARPVAVMMLSQAFGALVLPVTVACLIYIGNRRALMGVHAFRPLTNVLLALTLLFALTMSVLSYRGLFAALSA
jgi:Mn2+/Fe2+ NRAMP family transporter